MKLNELLGKLKNAVEEHGDLIVVELNDDLHRTVHKVMHGSYPTDDGQKEAAFVFTSKIEETGAKAIISEIEEIIREYGDLDVLATESDEPDWSLSHLRYENERYVKNYFSSVDEVGYCNKPAWFAPGGYYGLTFNSLNPEDALPLKIQGDVLLKCNSTDSTVVIPEGIKTIGNFAFMDNKNIRSVELPATVELIGEAAFSKSSIESVTLPSGLKQIKSDAFNGCRQLKHINIPEKVKKIPYRCFANCDSLEEVEMNPKIKEIGKMAFWGCRSLKKCDFPVGVKLHDGTFSQCENLFVKQGPYIIRKDGKYLERYYDENCEEGIVPEGVERLGSCSLKKAKRIHLPSSLKIIDAFAFQMCKELEELEIPEGVCDIGESAFPHYAKLTKIRIPDSLEKIQMSALPLTLKEISISPDHSLIKADKHFIYSSDMKRVLKPVRDEEEYIIPDGVEVICSFSGLHNIKKISFPGTLKVIPQFTFAEYYCPVESIILNKGVREIESRASGDLNLKELHIPDTVNVVGKKAMPCDSVDLLVIEHWTSAVDQIVLNARIKKVLAVYPESVPKDRCERIEWTDSYPAFFIL